MLEFSSTVLPAPSPYYTIIITVDGRPHLFHNLLLPSQLLNTCVVTEAQHVKNLPIDSALTAPP